MTYEEQSNLFDEFVSKQKTTLLSKGQDYAHLDKLSNFKLAGEISGTTAEINCLNLIATKVARLGVLLNSKKKPNHESTQDSLLDLATYSFLLSCILHEKNKK